MIVRRHRPSGLAQSEQIVRYLSCNEWASLNFGVVLQTDPPATRVIELAKRAESLGFSHAWTFDSHVLWQEPFVIYSRILAETRQLIVGPMVTNPGTRDWTVLA